MGTCDCGQPTVWNDMCQDCNSEWEDRIYSYDDPVKRAPVKDTFFSDDVLGLHIDLRLISGVTALDKNYDFCLIYPNGATVKIARSHWYVYDLRFLNRLSNFIQR